MAHFTKMPLAGCTETGVFVWQGRLCVAAGGAVTAATSWGKGDTWTKGSNGEYTLQVDRAYRGATTTGGTIGTALTKAAAGVQGVEVKSKDFKAGTFVFRFVDMTTGTGTDPAAAVELDVTLLVIDTTNPKG